MAKGLKRQPMTAKLSEDDDLDVVLMEEGHEDMADLYLSEDGDDAEISPEVKLSALLDQDDINFLQQHRQTPDPSMSFDKMDVPMEHARLTDEVEYKSKNIRVNNLLTIRKPVKITPSMCRALGCNYDAATSNGFPGGWETIPDNRRHIFLKLKERHFAKYHGNIESHIIKESQLPKRWLRKTGYES